MTAHGRRLRISVVVDNDSWILPYVRRLVNEWRREGHAVRFVRSYDALRPGDIAFFLGCVKIAPPQSLSLHRHNLVAHSSDLPKGKGFAPLSWQILEGKNTIPVVLFEATPEVDAGPIYHRTELRFEGHELMDEMRDAQGQAVIGLSRAFVRRHPRNVGTPQRGKATFYRRRRPEDSRLDLRESLLRQFSLLRIADNDRFPAFFEHKGHRYVLRIKKQPRAGPKKAPR